MPGSFRLFRFRGIDVYLHWLWFAAAAYFLSSPTKESLPWSIITYLSLFLFVLLHEFGHALACRQTGGEANRIILWPLGGVAYVTPPNRPGAQLWSIVAGPLVNVLAVLVFGLTVVILEKKGLGYDDEPLFKLASIFLSLNWLLLKFNLLPVYPLDGGQIVRSLLWFVVGAANSLFIATLIGFAGSLALGLYALSTKNYFLVIVAGYLVMGNWSGFQSGLAHRRLNQKPRHAAFRCPHCHAAAFSGPLWPCPICQTSFDVFVSGGCCPQGHSFDLQIPCVECRKTSPLPAWSQPTPPSR
jgi:Zn-dependent protease